jgi:O-antigen/teichoic acid export membrane protein
MSFLNKPIFSSAVGWVSRIGAAIFGILTTRVVLLKLGAHDFGLIVILAGISGWMCLIEFGFSASIQNKIARKIGLRRPTEVIRSFCHKLTVLFIPFAFIASGVVALLVVKTGLVDFAGFIQVWVACLGVSLTNIGQILLRADMSMGNRIFVNIVPVVIAFLVFCLVYLVSLSNGGGVILYLIIMQLFPGVVLVIYLILRRPSFKSIRLGYLKRMVFNLMPTSSKFALTTVMGLLVLQIDYLVIARYLEPSDAAKYNLVMKVFGVVGMMNAAALNTMWPIITESFHQNDFKGAVKKGRQLSSIGLGVMFLSIIGVVLCRDFIFLDIFKIETSQQPSIFLVICVGFYWIMRAWTDVYSVFIQAVNRPQTLIFPILTQALVGIAIMFLLIPRLGVAGIPISLGLGFMLTVGWYLPLKINKIIKY